MIESLVFLLIGLLLLISGGEFLVRTSSILAIRFGVSPLVVGLTVVAFGTSAPELGVSLFAAINSNPEIALTNVIGSNIFNIGFILGTCAIVSPLIVNLQLIKYDIPILIIASGIVYLFCYNGLLSKFEGLTLLIATFVYSCWLIYVSKRESKSISDGYVEDVKQPFSVNLWFSFIAIFLSIGVLVVGSKLLVTGATTVAKNLGISDTLIGLTIVAAGTSLPEFATSLMATLRGKTDIAIGNVIGSNIFNLFLILGISSIFDSGLKVNRSLISFDIPTMVLFALLSFPLLITSKRLVRWEGLVLFSCYIIYTFFSIQRG